MALFDLNRSNDTPISTLALASITPRDWPTLPEVMPSTTPEYVREITYTGGAVGDDISVSTANATDDYTPRNQAGKAALMVPAGELAVDIGKDYGPYARGDIEPFQPYPEAPPPEE